MKNITSIILAILATSSFALADATIGKPAPDFSVADATGKVHKLSDYKGKFVILEWFNKECPYVKKHYGSGNMQNIQAALKQEAEKSKKSVVWLSVNSSAKGKEGYLDAAATLKDMKNNGSNADAMLLDTDGKMGHAYGAKTTPHMYLIDDKGILLYNGAIDSNSSSDPATIATSENYIKAAALSAFSGEKIAKATSKPYGCSVKYQQ